MKRKDQNDHNITVTMNICFTLILHLQNRYSSQTSNFTHLAPVICAHDHQTFIHHRPREWKRQLETGKQNYKKYMRVEGKECSTETKMPISG
jgi:hypothetical protein